MPKGVPKNGFRKTKNWQIRMKGKNLVANVPTTPVKVETEAEIYLKLKDRFAAMDTLAEATARGKNRSLIISGPAGLGKSFGVMNIVSSLEDKGYKPCIIRGYVRPTGLYKTLYDFKDPNCVVVFDDADSVFMDDVSLNILKTACDMTKSRKLHWLAETRMEDELGERLPRSFEFQGSVIFITNYDFDHMIESGTKLAPHFEAMISRSHYLDLAMHTKLDYIVRIKQVVKECNMLRDQGFTTMDEDIIIGFIVKHQDKLRELSLRMVIKLAGLYKMNKATWEKLALVTCTK